jgi:hypothetical protein
MLSKHLPLLQCTYKKMLTFLFHPRRREESCLPQQAYHLLLQHHLALLCIRRLHMSWTRNQSDPWRVSMLGKLCMFMTVQNLWSFCKELFIMSDRVSDIKKHNSTSSQDCHDGHDILDKIFKLQRELFRPRMKLRILNVAKYILCVSFLLCQYVASVLLLAMRALLLLAANRTASLVMTITVSPSCKSS